MAGVYRVAALAVRNYKAAEHVDIVPDADANWLLIAGNNANGKTSVLEALDVSFGGKEAQLVDPVRHGAAEATVEVSLAEVDGVGRMTIERTIKPDGISKIKLMIDGAVVKAPQERLNDLIGARSLDPLAFLRLKAKEQRQKLIDLIDTKGELAKLEERRDKIFAKRTEVGREVDRAKGELDRLPERAKVGEPTDVAQLAKEREAIAVEMNEVANYQSAAVKAEHAMANAQRELDSMLNIRARADGDIAKLEQQLIDLRKFRVDMDPGIATATSAVEAAHADKAVRAAYHWKASEAAKPRVIRLAVIQAELAAAGQHNKAITEAELQNRRRDEAEKHVTEQRELQQRQTKLLATIDAEKAAFLKAASLPVPGLDFDGTGLVLNGAPFSQASSAESIRVAFGIAKAASPHLADIWIRDGALLDDDSMEALKAAAEESGHRVWVEIVRPVEGAIIIEHGKVRS